MMKRELQTVLVSSCLLGLKTRYDATDNFSQAVIDFIQKNHLIPIPVCPEQLAGLTTPRPKCWFSKGDGQDVLTGKGCLINEQGRDLTAEFLHGASQTLRIAQLTGCQIAILQQRSPSCGTLTIYLNQVQTKGMGITAALLEQHGVKLFADDNLPKNL